MKLFEDKIEFGFSDNTDGNLDFRFDEAKLVLERREKFFDKEKIDPKSSVVMIAEHKNNILDVSKEDAGKGVMSSEDQYVCDGLFTHEKNLNLILSVADCIALILYDKQNETLAMVHVGSKNLAIGTVGKAVDAMKKSGRVDSAIVATTGPFIKKCCYEFDKIPEHLKSLEKYFISSPCHPESASTELRTDKLHGAESKDPLTMRERDFSTRPPGKSVGMTKCYYLDTEAALKDQLLASGIKEENMQINPLCSMHDGFPSHKRSQKEGLEESRMLVYARMMV